MAEVHIDLKSIGDGLVREELQALNIDLGLGLTAEAVSVYGGSYPHVRMVPPVRKRGERNGSDVLCALSHLDPELYGRLIPVEGSHTALTNLYDQGSSIAYHTIHLPYHDEEVRREIARWLSRNGYPEGEVYTALSNPDLLMQVAQQPDSRYIFSKEPDPLIESANRMSISELFDKIFARIGLVAVGWSHIPYMKGETPFVSVTPLPSWDL